MSKSPERYVTRLFGCYSRSFVFYPEKMLGYHKQESFSDDSDHTCQAMTTFSELKKNNGGDSFIFGRISLAKHVSKPEKLDLSLYRNVTDLDLTGNQLNSTEFLCNLPSLIRLDLSHNTLTDFNGIRFCGNLQVVRVSNNRVTCIPRLASLQFLRQLEVDNNQIECILGLKNCPSLKYLNLGNNQLTSTALLGLEKKITNDSTGFVNQFYNELRCDKKQAKPILLSLSCLRTLILSNNPEIFGYLNLTLDEGDRSCPRQCNEHDGMPSSISHRNKLRKLSIFPRTLIELHLAHCSITQIDGLTNLPVLRTLNLSQNHIVDVASLRLLQSSPMLRSLNLLDNPVTEQNNYRPYLIWMLDHLTCLDERPIGLKEKVYAKEYHAPNLKQQARHDHRINTLYQFTHPQTIRDCTLQTESNPYPILALIGPAGSLKRQLSHMLIEKAGDLFALLKLHTDSPDWWQSARAAHESDRDTDIPKKRSTYGYVEENVGHTEYDMEKTIPEIDQEHITPDEFDRLRSEGEFIQTVRVGAHQYGLTWSSLEAVARRGLAGVFTGELESMISLRMTSLQPRFILCLPEDCVVHETRLRNRCPAELFLSRLKNHPLGSGLVADSLKQQNEYIQWCLDRAKNSYPQFYRDNPGWFDAVVDTTHLATASSQLLSIVMDYLGTNLEDLALNNRTAVQLPAPNLSDAQMVHQPSVIMQDSQLIDRSK